MSCKGWEGRMACHHRAACCGKRRSASGRFQLPAWPQRPEDGRPSAQSVKVPESRMRRLTAPAQKGKRDATGDRIWTGNEEMPFSHFLLSADYAFEIALNETYLEFTDAEKICQGRLPRAFERSRPLLRELYVLKEFVGAQIRRRGKEAGNFHRCGSGVPQHVDAALWEKHGRACLDGLDDTVDVDLA